MEKETMVATVPQAEIVDEQQLSRDVTDIEFQAESLVIQTDEDYAFAGEFGKMLKKKASQVTTFFKPMKDSAYQAHKAVCDREKAMLTPLRNAEKTVKQVMSAYIAEQEELSPQELMAKALLVAQKTLTDRDARIKELTAQNQIMQPKAEYFDELVARNLLTNFRETAKELGIKEKDFIGWLLDHKYVYRDQKNKLMPYAAKNNGLFEVKEGKGRHNDWAGTQTLITPKGRETFRLLCKEPPVLPQFTAL